MKFEWDAVKAASNYRKHRVRFEEGATIFLDPFAMTFEDPDHSHNEQRFVTIGWSDRHRVLLVAHTDREFDRVRIVSARRATKRECHDYEETTAESR